MHVLRRAERPAGDLEMAQQVRAAWFSAGAVQGADGSGGVPTRHVGGLGAVVAAQWTVLMWRCEGGEAVYVEGTEPGMACDGCGQAYSTAAAYRSSWPMPRMLCI